MPRIPDAVLRRIPPLARRDRRISSLETDLARARRRHDAAQARLARVHQELTLTRDQARQELEAARADARQEAARLREAADAQRRTARRARAALDRQNRQNERLDEALNQSEERRKDFEARLRRPSFRAKLSGHLAAQMVSRQRGWHDTSPQAQLTVKLRNYALAQSHGVDTPRIHGVWNSPREIRLDDISLERLVLKADRGHSGQAVIPLARGEHGWQTLDGAETLVDGRPTARIVERLDTGGSGPYFAEEFLEPEGGGTLPADIKVYTCYGEVLQVLVMQTHGVETDERGSFSRRYFDASGESLGRVLPRVKLSFDIPRPEPWDQLMDAARRLSVAVGLPFVRVDLYTTSRGPVLGELTPAPGGIQLYRQDHDLAMGAAWTDAEVRLERDLARGRPPGALYGEQEYTWWYDAVDVGDASDDPEHPAAWPRRVADPEAPFTPSRPEDRPGVSSDAGSDVRFADDGASPDGRRDGLSSAGPAPDGGAAAE